jgi:glycosyltransferase involved in cell wall biosynthesis
MRLAVVSPFLDRRHGTERVVIEQLERLSALPGLEIHVYAQRLEDLARAAPFDSSARSHAPGSIVWHKVSSLPGPHLFGYIWWFFANQFHRWRDARFRGLTYDLVYSPGINAWDADAIAIHIVFHELYRRVRSRLQLRGSPLTSRPRLLHRHLYYRLVMGLERRIYSNPRVNLAAVSGLVARHVTEYFHRSDARVILNSVDTDRFTPAIRSRHRVAVREHLGLSDDHFVLLLIGNDWETKGLHALLHSLAECRDLPLKLFVVGADDRSLFLPQVRRLGLEDRVQFLPSSGEVVQFYAAADVYAGPSLEDAFALPPIEAMACGLPVITSVNNGGSQIITEAVDGFVLSDPTDVSALARLVRLLYEQPELCRRVGENAARTAQAYNWDRNAAETWQFLKDAAARKQDARRRQEAR